MSWGSAARPPFLPPLPHRTPFHQESKLSAYFRLGLLSMVSVHWAVDRSLPQAQKWLRRMAWRDYAYWMLSYWQDLPERPMRPAYAALGWAEDAAALRAWQTGTTGYPVVDAAMRELLQTGYLQQHMRHVVGQFLVEALGVCRLHPWSPLATVPL